MASKEQKDFLKQHEKNLQSKKGLGYGDLRTKGDSFYLQDQTPAYPESDEFMDVMKGTIKPSDTERSSLDDVSPTAAPEGLDIKPTEEQDMAPMPQDVMPEDPEDQLEPETDQQLDAAPSGDIMPEQQAEQPVAPITQAAPQEEGSPILNVMQQQATQAPQGGRVAAPRLEKYQDFEGKKEQLGEVTDERRENLGQFQMKVMAENDEYLEKAEKIKRDAQAVLAEHKKMIEEQREKLESAIPNMAKNVEKLKQKRDDLLTKTSNPIHRRNLLVGKNAYLTAANMIGGGLLDFFGKVANIEGGTQFETFFEKVDEMIEKDYQEQVANRDNDVRIYQEVSKLYGDEKAGLDQYKKESYELFEGLIDLNMKGVAQDEAFTNLKKGVKDKEHELVEKLDSDLYAMGVKEVTTDIAITQKENELVEKSNQDKLKKYEAQIKDVDNIRKNKLERAKQYADQYNKEQDRGIKREDLAIKRAKEDRQERKEDKKLSLQEQQFAYEKERDKKKDANKALDQYIDLEKLDQKKTEKGQGPSRNFKSKSGKLIPIKLTEGASKDTHKQFDDLEKTVGTLHRVEKAATQYAKYMFSGNFKKAKELNEAILKPLQVELKAGVRITLTGGGNISEYEQKLLKDYASGDISWPDVVNKFTGNTKREARKKLIERGEKVTKKALNKEMSFLASKKFKNIRFGVEDSYRKTFESYLDLNDPNSQLVLQELGGGTA